MNELALARLENQEQINEVKIKIVSLKQSADKLVVASSETYEQAARLLVVDKDMQKLVKEYHRPDIKRADDLHKSLVAKEKEILAGLVAIEASMKNKMLAWNEKEKRRVALEQAAALEKQRKIDDDAAARAKAALKDGKTEKAQAILNNIKQVPIPTVETSIPKVSGISIRTIWHHRVVDETKIPREYLIPNTTMLESIAKASKGEMKVPGVVFYSEESMSGGSGRTA